MPVKYVVIKDGRLVIERWVGTISHAEAVAHTKARFQDSAIVRDAKALVDARAAVFPETSVDLIHEVSDLHGHPDNKISLSTYAAVFGSGDFDKAKVWEAQLRQRGVNAIVFNNLEVACIWLGIDPAEAQRQLDQLDL